MPEAFFRSQAVALLAGALADGSPDEQSVHEALVVPPRADQGDFALPCFMLARILRQAPPKIAQSLAEALGLRVEASEHFVRVEAVGPYVNLFVSPEARARITLEAIEEVGDAFGTSEAGQGRAVCVDFSSPNIAKPFGIGHLRSTVIGSAICKLYRASGWRPVGINHLGDWGKQFGMLMVALADQGAEGELDAAAAPMQCLYQHYVRIHREAKEDGTIEPSARAWFRKLEDGDGEARRLWQKCVDVSLQEFRRVYQRLGVAESFSHWWGESHYEGEPMARVIRELEGHEILTESEGARVVFLEEADLPPCLIVKADGATLYATRDLAGAIYRQEHDRATRLVYVVGAAQATHFKQIFLVLEKMGYSWAKDCVHVPFGLIQGMSTRKGTMVLLEEVLEEAVSRVRAIVDERDYPEAEKALIAEQVGVGAVIFADLSNLRVKDWEFDWEQLLNFNGRTGPYLQYTRVRMRSVLDKYGQEISAAGVDWTHLGDPEAQAVLRQLGGFPGVVARACAEHEPSVVSRYLLDLAEANNRFYNARRVVDPEQPELSKARSLLVSAVCRVLENGLALLNVPLPERM